MTKKKKSLQPDTDVDIAAGHLGGAEEDVAAVAARAVDPDRVLPAVRRRAVERDLAALVAVGCVCWPRRRVQPGLEVLDNLAEGEEREEREGNEGGSAKH